MLIYTTVIAVHGHQLLSTSHLWNAIIHQGACWSRVIQRVTQTSTRHLLVWNTQSTWNLGTNQAMDVQIDPLGMLAHTHPHPEVQPMTAVLVALACSRRSCWAH